MADITPIARIETPFAEKFGVPRQSGVADCSGRIVFAPAYRDPAALRGLEEFSHIWLIWQFDRALREGWSPTVLPPKLGGKTRVGVCDMGRRDRCGVAVAYRGRMERAVFKTAEIDRKP